MDFLALGLVEMLFSNNESWRSKGMELKGKNKYLACIKTIVPNSYITFPGQKRNENYTSSQHRMNTYKDNTKNLDANSFIFGKRFTNSYFLLWKKKELPIVLLFKSLQPV